METCFHIWPHCSLWIEYPAPGHLVLHHGSPKLAQISVYLPFPTGSTEKYPDFFPISEKLRLAGFLSLCIRVLNSESGAGQYAYFLLWFPSFYPGAPQSLFFYFPFLPGRNMSHALPSLLSEEGFALPFSLGHSGRRIGDSKRNTLEGN